MEFLGKQNQVINGENSKTLMFRNWGKLVLVMVAEIPEVICIGNIQSEHGAASITNWSFYLKPPQLTKTPLIRWPECHDTQNFQLTEGKVVDRVFSILTKEFIGKRCCEVTGLKLVDLEWMDRGWKNGI